MLMLGFSSLATNSSLQALLMKRFLGWLLSVSYTHLDVYKRQDKSCDEDDHGIGLTDKKNDTIVLLMQ